MSTTNNHHGRNVEKYRRKHFHQQQQHLMDWSHSSFQHPQWDASGEPFETSHVVSKKNAISSSSSSSSNNNNNYNNNNIKL
jgi:hypothetical protein